MTNIRSQKIPAQIDEKAEDLTEEASAMQEQESKEPSGPNKPRRGLSKREIMEQLSRDRFPWDE
jgi:hypothetical protein